MTLKGEDLYFLNPGAGVPSHPITDELLELAGWVWSESQNVGRFGLSVYVAVALHAPHTWSVVFVAGVATNLPGPHWVSVLHWVSASSVPAAIRCSVLAQDLCALHCASALVVHRDT